MLSIIILVQFGTIENFFYLNEKPRSGESDGTEVAVESVVVCVEYKVVQIEESTTNKIRSCNSLNSKIIFYDK